MREQAGRMGGAVWRFWRRSLSLRLLGLTILFVMGGTLVALVPALAGFRETWLTERLSTAHIAALALEAAPGNRVAAQLEEELLRDAAVFSVAVERQGARYLVLRAREVPPVAASFDLAQSGMADSIRDALASLLAPPGRVIRVAGQPMRRPNSRIEIVLDERFLQNAMAAYVRTLLGLGLIVSTLAAALLFLSTHLILVRPLERLSASMRVFRRRPEDAGRIIVPGARRDEIGQAQRELASLQKDLRSSLHQKTRLAALGEAVGKINHDLRNMLASAQLVSERLSESDDPMVRRLAPRFFSAIDRASRLCTETLEYGQGQPRLPNPARISLRGLIEQAGEAAGLPEGGMILWANEVPPEMGVRADPDHLFRVLLNLGRNAVQAIEKSRKRQGAKPPGRITIRAGEAQDHVWIELHDTGSGFSRKARENIFKPFAGSDTREGFGLGLPISLELIRAQGGALSLVETGAQGTLFRITLPRIEAQAGEEAAAR